MRMSWICEKKFLKFSLFLILAWYAMSSIASENQYTFVGNRWNEDGRHLVGVFADVTQNNRPRAAVSIDTNLGSTISASVVFSVEADDELVFDGALYRVKSIRVDKDARERLKDAYINGKTIAPGEGDIRDSVTIVRVGSGVSYGKEEFILPQGPGVLSFTKSKSDEQLEFFLDEVSGKDGALQLRWNVGSAFGRSTDEGRSTSKEGPMARVGEKLAVSGFGKFEITNVMTSTSRHGTWVIIKFAAEP